MDKKYMAKSSCGPDPHNIKQAPSNREKKFKGYLEFVSRFGQENIEPEEIRNLLGLSNIYQKQQQEADIKQLERELTLTISQGTFIWTSK